MNEDAEQQEEALLSDEVISPAELNLAKYLVHYHRYSLNVRSRHIGKGGLDIDPPEVRELVNFLCWMGNGFNVVTQVAFVYAMREVIEDNQSKFANLVSQVRLYGADERQALELIALQKQVTAAGVMMELITDG